MNKNAPSLKSQGMEQSLIVNVLSFITMLLKLIFSSTRQLLTKLKKFLKSSNEKSSNVDIRNIDILPIGNQKSNSAEKRAGLMVWHFDQFEVIKKEFSKQMGTKFT